MPVPLTHKSRALGVFLGPTLGVHRGFLISAYFLRPFLRVLGSTLNSTAFLILGARFPALVSYRWFFL